jgi:hypothetical protein
MTDIVLTQMKTVLATVAGSPTKVVPIFKHNIKEQIGTWVGNETQIMDMDSMAKVNPLVAASLKQAGITGEHWNGYEQALTTADKTLRQMSDTVALENLNHAGREAMREVYKKMTTTTPLEAKNIAFIKAHAKEVEEFWQLYRQEVGYLGKDK